MLAKPQFYYITIIDWRVQGFKLKSSCEAGYVKILTDYNKLCSNTKTNVILLVPIYS